MKAHHSQRLLGLYAGTVTVFLALFIGLGAVSQQKQSFDEITVRRINIVEPDGTIRMVISDHANLPGVIIKGKEYAPNRPGGGMLFYNDEGSENGGLIFGGGKNSKGEVVDSGESLSFDQYGMNGQIVQLAGVNDVADRFAGLKVWGITPSSGRKNRVWVGHTADGTASVALMDENGRKRIVMEVRADGTSNIDFLDASGKIINRLAP
jgi:hypothetical protein